MAIYSEKELYAEIINRIELDSNDKNISQVEYAMSIGIPRSTFFGMKRYLNTKNSNRVISSDTLKEYALKLDFDIKQECFNVKDHRKSIESLD